MWKLNFKDIMMFLKIFGVSSIFFISGIIICFIGRKYLNINWPEYIVISIVLIFSGIIVSIIETIRYIKTYEICKCNKYNKKIKKINNNLDILKNYLDHTGYLSWIVEQERKEEVKKDEKNL
jgi:hypothetical protein